MAEDNAALLASVRQCTLCAPLLPLEPKPILQWHPAARILIAGQAPGKKAHDAAVPFADASGERLRSWLGLTAAQFYNPRLVAILPMGFCFPGTGKSGDLPPRPECAATWQQALLQQLTQLQLTVVIGKYAQAYHLADAKPTLTATVASWQDYWPQKIPLPHPSPRNNIWLKRNPWFVEDLLPVLQIRVQQILASGE
ncbi:MAG: IclR family transcriptional regulator [Rheinheimera sp.]|uniref:uracil-DNA glycosylase family protein n=1 Tax=Arsukibacterium sp. UBA3155 TaxID=1946058 RepID=UPI000C8BDE2E|nr:uracil-DNA glycosylase family protein [Arsukibacterium sp. UBA3155]MAD73547.1 IclR family transcriptional regulator [Rheinheimera sp.]|tara:strand:- start:86812 stop:87402 length:591 start_codon:yes stop_codon:yes gene_type:complete